MRRLVFLFLTIVAAVPALTGCAPSAHALLSFAQPTTEPAAIALPTLNSDVRALVTPPISWRADPLKSTARHKHQVWVSPTGDTAYGVIRFELHLPLPVEVVLLGFLSEMKRDQGESHLLYSKSDKSLPGLRFACEGGRYRLRGNMLVRGAGGWVFYAGTLRSRPENMAELATAEHARDCTSVAPSK